MVRQLNPDDIKILKKNLQQGYWYGAVILIFFVILFIFSLNGNTAIEPSALIFFGLLLSSFMVWLLNGSYYRDLQSGEKDVVKKKLEMHDDERKIKKSKVGALFAAWGQSKKKKPKNFLLHIDNATFEVTEEQVKEAEKKGSIMIHYAIHSKKVLRIEVP